MGITNFKCSIDIEILITENIHRMKNTLVLGASLKPERYSNKAIYKLVEKGITTYAYGLRAGEIAGVTIGTTLSKIEGIHTVALYLNPSRQEEFYTTIVNLKPKRVLFNPGTENPKLYYILKNHKIAYEEACTLVLLATNQY